MKVWPSLTEDRIPFGCNYDSPTLTYKVFWWLFRLWADNVKQRGSLYWHPESVSQFLLHVLHPRLMTPMVKEKESPLLASMTKQQSREEGPEKHVLTVSPGRPLVWITAVSSSLKRRHNAREWSWNRGLYGLIKCPARPAPRQSSFCRNILPYTDLFSCTTVFPVPSTGNL